jgi:geranylgeranyl pyrophosphate synthase
MSDIEKFLEGSKENIEKEMLKVFPREGIENLNDAVWYHLNSGGKRIRPGLAIATCKALGGDVKKVMPFAAACEVTHNWLLVHDDIQDLSEMRRNKPAVWKKYGISHAINIGDYMSQKVYEMILKSREYGVDEKTILRLIDETVWTCIKTAEGQALEINLKKNNSPTEREYMEMVKGKTAYYLTNPMVGGAVIARASEDVIKQIRTYGMYAGPAFQIADDLLDLTAAKGRGETGSDIKEGKRSIMVVHCVSRCSENEKTMFLEILNKPVEETGSEDVLWVKGLFERYGSIQYAEEKARELADEAKKSISDLQPQLRDMLSSFADYMVERKK